VSGTMVGLGLAATIEQTPQVPVPLGASLHSRGLDVTYGPHPLPEDERFWRHVDRSDDAQCWLWTGARYANGYGVFHVGGMDGHNQTAHRVAYRLTHGPIPDGLYVCHTCDNPPCVNPAHLFSGTATDNMQDASRKGRIRAPVYHGEGHPSAILTASQVAEIRATVHLNRAGVNGSQVTVAARRYGVSCDTIRDILRGRSWCE
jgi:hypothetical protein